MTTNKIVDLIEKGLTKVGVGAEPLYALGYNTALKDLMREINHAIKLELEGNMTELGERNYALISEAIKCTGEYDPNEILFMFEERLYVHEGDTIEAFLQWVVDGGYQLKHGFLKSYHRGFGSGNYEERFQEFLKQR